MLPAIAASIWASLGRGVVFNKAARRHHLARLAVAALHDILLDPGLLHRVQLSRRSKALDRCDCMIHGGTNPSLARTDRVAVEMDGADAAKPQPAAVLRSHHSKLGAQHPQQGRVSRGAHVDGFTVEGELHKVG